MSKPQPTSGTTNAELITDYETLKARQQTIHTWSVLNLDDDGGEHTVYEVNTLQRSCSCADEKYNKSDNEACKHLAYVLSGSGKSIEIGDAMAFDLGNAVREARETLKDITHATSAPTATNQTGGTTPEAEADADDGGSDDDTDAAYLDDVKDKAARAGVPVGKGVSVYVDDQYGSIQIEKDPDGNLDDGEFSDLIDFVHKDGISGTGGDYHWYVADVEGVV